jgi:lipopolysaccharide/colanic/teichoic acid biosynthesis glycosyltransferase/VanZ family protein
MKRFVRYWAPPILWMAFLFPVTNKTLGSSITYEVFVAVLRWIAPHASPAAVETGYIIFRKSIHFVSYGLLAFLLTRALRAGRRPLAEARWFIGGAALAAAYGFLDEFLQSFVPTRTGSPIDWLVDNAGILTVTLVAFSRARDRDEGRLAPPGPNSLARAMFLKRPFDIALSSLGLLLSSPLWAVIALAIWLEDRGPVFYSQERVGRNGRIFRAMKFRSMVKDAEKDRGPVQAVAHDPRVTRVGRVLRGTAMDELPQLLNIFRGDMSFVGPRALRPNEQEVNGGADDRSIESIPGYEGRHAVRPGLTGLTQVYLPGETPRRKKFRYDLLYIRKRSFWLDLELILLSFWITFRGKWESREDKI